MQIYVALYILFVSMKCVNCLTRSPLAFKLKSFKNKIINPQHFFSTFSYSPSKIEGDELHTWTLRFDGGSRGNPGHAGSGAVLYGSENSEMWYGYFYIGDNETNNAAEYNGLIEGLKAAAFFSPPRLQVEGDSKLVIYQTNGEWKVKIDNLKPYHKEAQQLVKSLQSINNIDIVLRYIPREMNSRADQLANLAMDTKTSWSSPIHSK